MRRPSCISSCDKAVSRRPSDAEVRVGGVCCFAAAARALRGLPCAARSAGRRRQLGPGYGPSDTPPSSRSTAPTPLRCAARRRRGAAPAARPHLCALGPASPASMATAQYEYTLNARAIERARPGSAGCAAGRRRLALSRDPRGRSCAARRGVPSARPRACASGPAIRAPSAWPSRSAPAPGRASSPRRPARRAPGRS